MMHRRILLLSTLIFGVQGLGAEESSGDSYRLFPRDQVTLSVYGESALNTQLRLSGNGGINIPLLGNLQVGQLTLAEAEAKIAKTYVEREIFISPQITLQVAEYSKKEISILGQISNQGRVELPPETATLSIIEAVSAAGGLSRIAKGDSVRITRKNLETGDEEVFIVDVESMIVGKSKEDAFYVFPGDIIFVPERLF
jgi:protein involved in polysaccharide export with SLBB domain